VNSVKMMRVMKIMRMPQDIGRIIYRYRDIACGYFKFLLARNENPVDPRVVKRYSICR
jgi:hypothetical protein